MSLDPIERAAAEPRAEVLEAGVLAYVRGLKAIIEALNGLAQTPDGEKLTDAFREDLRQLGQSMFEPVEGGDGQEVSFLSEFPRLRQAVADLAGFPPARPGRSGSH